MKLIPRSKCKKYQLFKGGGIPKFQKPSGTIRRLNNEDNPYELARNKAKQQELIDLGHKEIQVDGSWGSYQDKLYRNRTNTKRDNYLKSLDDWISKNPTYKSINTKDFRNFFDQLVDLESSYDLDKIGGSPSPGTNYRGWYQTVSSSKRSEDDQHKAAFDHLISILNNQITDKDLEQAKSKSISHSQLLAKYWNQGNHVTNWLYGGSDNPIGNNPKISEYGFDVKDASLNLSKYVGKAITGDYIILGNGESINTYAPRVRNSNIDYSDSEASIRNMNKGRILGKKSIKRKLVDRVFPEIWPNDTLYINKSIK